jgi:hypothetical protein
MTHHRRLLPWLILGALGAAGCSTEGDYRVTWSFADGEISSAGDCSRRGVVEVVVRLTSLADGTVHRAAYPCSQGGTGLQHLPRGTYRLEVQAYGPTRLPFTDPATGKVALREGVAEVEVTDGDPTAWAVTFTPNPRCADGVDNDGDGLVDAADPGCLDKNGEWDPDPARDETNLDLPGLLDVTFGINGGRDACSETQPAAAFASVTVDGLEVGRFACSAGGGAIPLGAGTFAVGLELRDASDVLVATAPTRDATVLAEETTEVAFDLAPDAFATPQVGELRFALSWGTAGAGCGDASPIVETQSLWLETAGGETVDATLVTGEDLSGGPGSVGECRDPAVIQAVAGRLPVGLYALTITGYAPGELACHAAYGVPVEVLIGANAAHEVTVAVTDASGCEP